MPAEVEGGEDGLERGQSMINRLEAEKTLATPWDIRMSVFERRQTETDRYVCSQCCFYYYYPNCHMTRRAAPHRNQTMGLIGSLSTFCRKFIFVDFSKSSPRNS